MILTVMRLMKKIDESLQRKAVVMGEEGGGREKEEGRRGERNPEFMPKRVTPRRWLTHLCDSSPVATGLF